MCTFGPPWSNFLCPNSLASGNHKSDLFSYEFTCMFLNYNHSIILSLCSTTWWFSISVPIKMTVEYILLWYVTMWRSCLVTMFPTLHSSYSWLIYFAAGSLCPLIFLIYFFLSLTSFPWGATCSLYLWVCFCYVCSLGLFLDPTYEWKHAVFVFPCLTSFI